MHHSSYLETTDKLHHSHNNDTEQGFQQPSLQYIYPQYYHSPSVSFQTNSSTQHHLNSKIKTYNLKSHLKQGLNTKFEAPKQFEQLPFIYKSKSKSLKINITKKQNSNIERVQFQKKNWLYQIPLQQQNCKVRQIKQRSSSYITRFKLSKLIQRLEFPKKEYLYFQQSNHSYVRPHFRRVQQNKYFGREAKSLLRKSKQAREDVLRFKQLLKRH